MRWLFLFLFSLSFSFLLKAQLAIEGHADCDKALDIEMRRTVGPTTAPDGYGEELEFSKNPKNSVHFIENEHNTVWYTFIAKQNSKMIFELEPLDSLDDYDFAFYEYTDENFCKEVINQRHLPIRTNFSRNKPEIGSWTGLKFNAESSFVGAGVNPAFSQSFETQAGKRYYLLVDNVYDDGKGHILHFEMAKEVSLEGTILDDSNNPVGATVALTNLKTGEIITEVTSEPTTGKYKIVVDVKLTDIKDPMSLQAYSDGHFFKDTTLMLTKIPDLKNIKIDRKLPKLKKGSSFAVNTILFVGNKPQPLATSFPILKLLHKTMSRNKTLKIKVEGHTNGCGTGVDCNWLSHARAETVVNYLSENGIQADRMTFEGLADREMLYPDTRGPKAYLNRRVEIIIEEY